MTNAFELHPGYVKPFEEVLADVRAGEVVGRDNVRIAYEVVGDKGPVIALANGLGGRLYAWLPLIESLRDRYRFVTWDYRGLFASESNLTGPAMGIPRHADDLAAVLDAEGIDAAHLCGWSMGVQVSLEFATRFPERVKSLILINGTYGQVFSTAFQPFFQIPVQHTRLHSLVELAVKFPFVVQGVMRTSLLTVEALFHLSRRLGQESHPLVALGLRQYLSDILNTRVENYLKLFQELDAHSVYHLLPLVTHRTLIVSGSLDFLTPDYQSKQMARRIPGAYHLRIPLGTHFVLLERPSVVLPAVRKHLNKVDRPRTGEGKSKAKRTTGSRKSTSRRDSPKARAR
ncbi:MAG: alpha/beta hydrolase [Deltaproteobacteria bacterium]|nr:alpha/beta hydrolase [Deltaproteobacteria bacterium]